MSSLSQIPNRVSNKTCSAVLAFISLAASASLGASTPNQVSTPQLLAAPMSFEANQGQTADSVRFLSRGPGYTFFLTPREAVLSLRSIGTESSRRGQRRPQPKMNQACLTMTFMGANPRPEVEGVGQLAGTANYFIGNDSTKWQTGVPTYGKVKYHDLYPGVDLIYYGNQRQVEYDFVIEPKADPKRIAISFSGADKLEVDSEGGLIAHLASGDIRWKKPLAYQESSGGKVEVPVKFVLKHRREIGFQLASYDTTKPLTIDPVLVYATYLGGNKGDFVAGIAVNAAGNAYIIGDTTSLNFPTTSAFRTTSVGTNEVFVTKLNPSGSGLIYSTYIGGSSNDFAAGIALDASGNAYLTGETESPNFPTRNAAYPGNAGFNDAFVTKLGPFGTNLVYSTYLGGNGDDSGRAIAVDSGGNVYVTGSTYSKGSGNGPFPTTQGAYQGNNGGGNAITADAFVTKFDTNGVLSYSTFLGGSTDEKANGIAVDSSGNAYVVGEVASYPTYPTPPSSDFPVVNAFQSSFNRGNLDPLAGNKDGFLTKLNATGTGLIFSTFLGGNDEDTITGIALDAAGRVHVTGITSSTNFPTVNAAQPLNAGTVNDPDFPGPDAFISKFETNGASLLYSTYLGGSIDEFPFLLDRFGIAVDKFGDIYVAGQTGSFDFPVTIGADQTTSEAAVDAFIVKINPAVPGPASLIYSTLLSGGTGVLPGGADNEAGPIAVDNNGNFYIAGITSSTNFPVTAGSLRSTNGGGIYDAFVAKFSSPADLSVTMTPSVEPVTIGSNVIYTIQVNNNGRSTFSGVTNFVQFTTNVRLGPISTTLGSFRTNSGLVTFNIGTLTNNASVTQTIMVTNLSAGFYTNTATLTSTETPSLELNTDNNVATVLSSVRGIADVTLTQSAAPSPVLVSSNLVYTITINNKGPSTATSLVLTDTLPTSVTFVSATNTLGTCSNVAGVVICDFVPLINGTNARVTITTIAATNGVATNVANVVALEADFSPANNSSTLLTTINPLADLSLAMTVSTNLVFVGSNVTFTLLITNQGPSIATGVVITNPLPAGATLVSTTTTQGGTNLTSGVVAFNIGTMVSNGTATVTITLKLNNPGSATNTASIGSTASDPDPSDNTASATTMVGLTSPQLVVTPATLNFGIVAVGANVQASFTLTNLGGGSLSNGTASLDGGPFTVLSGTPFNLPGFGSTNLVVRFTPGSPINFSNNVIFNTSNAGNSTNAVTGTGAAVPVATFTASPTNGVKPLTVTFTDSSTGTITNRFWNFGDGSTTNTTATVFAHTYVNASTNTPTLTVTGPVGTNTLSQPNYIIATNLPPLLSLSPPSLNFGQVILGQTNAQNFQVVNSGGLTLTGAVATTLPFGIRSGTPFSLAPGQTGQVVVTFAPTNAISFSNVVVFTSNGGNSTNTVTGSGLTPGQLAVLPASLDFGTVVVGSNSQASFTITNLGSATLSNGVATVNAGPFTILSGTPFNLPGSGSTNLVIRFTPSSAANFTNVVTVTSSNAGNSTNAITGIGAAVPAATFTASPTNGVKPLTVTFTDSSTGTITNRFWNFGDGSTTNTTTTVFAHTYLNASTNTPTLTVTGPVGTNTLSRPNYITVTNPPPLLSLSPPNLDFGPVVLGQTNAQNFQVVNNGGLTLTGVVATTLPFGIQSGAPFSLAPGQTGQVVVTFAPTDAISFSNVVVFTSNGGNSTNTVTGSGLAPAQLAVLPASLDFGTVAVGSSAQASFTITNLGDTTLSNGVVTVNGGPFTILSGTPFNLSGSESTNLVIRFTPSGAGNFTNVVTFTSSNAGNSTNRVTGIGAVVPVASFTASPTNGIKPLTVTFTDSSTGTITNRFWDFGDGSTTNTSAAAFAHTYFNASTNTPTLTVTGPVGTDTLSRPNYITVTNLPPLLSLTPPNLNFGPVVVGQTNAQNFQIVNNGGLTLTGAAATTSPFGIQSGTPFSLAPGQTGQVVVTFAPTDDISFSNVVVFTSNGGNSTNSVTGSGLTPGELVVLPLAIDFGYVLVGANAQASFVITNSGGAPLGNGIATVTSGPFTILSGTPFSLPGFASTNLVVRFAPTSAASFSNVVTVTAGTNANSINSVTGIGATVPLADFAATPTSGVLPLVVSFVDNSMGTISNRFWNFGDGSTTNTTATTFEHTYINASTNTPSLTVTGPVGTNTLSRPNYITVTNPPPLLSLSPPDLDFGQVVVGQTNAQNFQIVNNGGLTLTGTASTTLPFGIRSGTPFSLAPGQTGQVVVTFAPTDDISFSNVVVFTSNGGNSTNTVIGSGLTPAQLAVLPASLDFGTVAVGSSAQASFTITNLGGVTLSNGVVTVNGGPFTILSGTPFNLPSSGSTNLVIRFTPSSAANFTNVVTFTSGNAGNSTNRVTGIGAVVPAATFSASPTNGVKPLTVTFTDSSTGTITNRFWDFGDGSTTNTTATVFAHPYLNASTNTPTLTVTGPVGTNTLSRPNYITVTNPPPLLSLTPPNLNFGPVVLGQTNAQNFQVVNNGGLTLTGTAATTLPFGIQSGTPFTLAPGGTGLVVVTFAPTNAISFSNVVVFTSNGGNSTNTVTGSGLRPAQLAVLPASLNFGTVAVGSSAQASFTITNLGGVTLSNGVATVDGGPFTILSGTPFNLPGSGSTNLVVRFTPSSATNFTNVVTFTSGNAGNSTNPVTGIGAVVPAATFTASPTNGVKPLTVTFTDSSTGTITNRFWNFGDGSTTNTTATAFAHTYLNASTNTPTLTVTGPVGTNTLSRPNYITVTNPPPLLSLSPPNLNFGQVVLGQTNAQNFQIVNNGGLTLTGTAATTLPFGIRSGTPFSLAPGQTGQVVVTFAPTNAISFSNVVVFTSNGGNSTNTVTGSGLTPAQLAVLPASLDFGTVAVGSNAQASFTITNLGGVTLSNGVVTVSAGPFTILSGTPFNLPGSGSTNLVIRFTPSSAANFTNVVTFTSGNAGNSTNRVTGIGAVVPVASFTASPTNGVKPLTVTFTDSSTGTITNRFWNFGDGSTTNTTATVFAHTYLNGSTNTPSLTVTGPVGTNTLSRPNYITVTNPPPLLSLSPPNLNFGPVVVGQTNAQNFQIVNNGGLTLTGAAATTSPFGIQSGTPFSLAPGQTGQVVVTFAPANAISFSNVVVFTSNGGNRTNSVTGSGLTPGELAVLPLAIDFGYVLVGANAQASFLITNSGGATLSNGTATVTSGPFTILSGTPFSLPGFSSTNLVVRFAPTSAASFSNAVTVTAGTNANSINSVIGIGAAVPAATFTASPTNGVKPLTVTFTDSSTGTITNRFWDFGDGSTTNTTATAFAHTYFSASANTPTLTVTGPVGTNTLSRPNYIIVTNPPPLLSLSPPNLNFGQVVLGQTNAQNFQVVNNGGLTLNGAVATTSPFGIRSGTPFSLAPGQTGQVVVTFAPTDDISFSNVVVFTSNGGNSTNTVIGSGLTPAQLAVLPASLDFGTVAVGSSAQASFTITNLGGVTLSNGVVTVNTGPFTILSGTPFNLPGSGSTNLVIRFTPSSAANFTNVVTFTSGNAGNSTNPLTGIGAIVPAATFTASPTNGVKPLTVTFTDSSTGTITNRFWDFGDGSTTNTSATVFPHIYLNASTNTPTLTVTGPVGTDTLSRPNYITVTNLPPLLSLSPPSLNFGPVVLGQTNAQNFQIINNGGLTLTGTAATTLPFGIQSGTPFTLPPGQTGQVVVTFAPTSAISFSNVVVFTSNGGNSTNSVTGSGLTPGQLAVLPLTIDFGYVLVGSTDQASFVITNSGGAPLTNGIATVATGPFTILSGTPFSLPGFASTNLVVKFAPTNAVSFSNVVTVTAGTNANSINSVIGIGATVPLADFDATPTSGVSPLVVSFADNSTGTITNRFWNFGDGATTNTTFSALAHTYMNSGTNTVTLLVSGPFGTSTQTRTNYIAVVNPLLLIGGIQLFGSDVVISFLSEQGRSYRLEYSDSLSGTTWQTGVDLIPGNGTTVQATHVGGAGTASRFYRIKRLP